VVTAVAEELSRQGCKAEPVPPEGVRTAGFWALQQI